MSALSFGGAAIVALACLGLVPGIRLSDDYAMPFYAWTFPLAVICTVFWAGLFHRSLATRSLPGAGSAGIAIALLTTLMAALIIGLVVAPGIKEVLGITFFIVFMLIKTGWLPLATIIGALTGVWVYHLARRHYRMNCV